MVSAQSALVSHSHASFSGHGTFPTNGYSRLRYRYPVIHDYLGDSGFYEAAFQLVQRGSQIDSHHFSTGNDAVADFYVREVEGVLEGFSLPCPALLHFRHYQCCFVRNSPGRLFPKALSDASLLTFIPKRRRKIQDKPEANFGDGIENHITNNKRNGKKHSRPDWD